MYSNVLGTRFVKVIVLEGSYRPREDEVLRLANVARLNKLYLAYLRMVGDAVKCELAREEARYSGL